MNAEQLNSDWEVPYQSIKIDRVDKSSPLHPYLLLGKMMSFEDAYACVVTKFGIIKSLISLSRLYRCSATNVEFNYADKLSYSAACIRKRMMHIKPDFARITETRK